MKNCQSLDNIDQSLLEILSFYEHLTVLELWWEMGEAGIASETSKEELLRRLETLETLGFVERFTTSKGEMCWAFVKKEKEKNRCPKSYLNNQKQRLRR